MLPFQSPQARQGDGNNMTNTRCPFKFSGLKGEDPMLFISNFHQFVLTNRLDEAQAIVTLRLSLAGDAEIWIRTQNSDTGHHRTGVSAWEISCAFFSKRERTFCNQ